MKILSDFDGVLTDPSGEAADLLARFRDKTRHPPSSPTQLYRYGSTYPR
jgi:hypothetical protein